MLTLTLTPFLEERETKVGISIRWLVLNPAHPEPLEANLEAKLEHQYFHRVFVLQREGEGVQEHRLRVKFHSHSLDILHILQAMMITI